MVIRDGTRRIVVASAVNVVTWLFARSGDQAHVDVTFSSDIWGLCRLCSENETVVAFGALDLGFVSRNGYQYVQMVMMLRMV